MPNEHSVFVFLIYNQHMYNGHSAILPEGRGKQGIKAGKTACQWMFNNTPCKKIWGFTPAHKKHIVRYNKLVGFTEEGLMKNCSTDSGKKCDMIVFGLEK